MRSDSYSRDWIEYQYSVLGKTAKTIASEIGYNASTVTWWIKKHGIQSHGRSYKTKKTPFLSDRNWLYSEYVTKNRTAMDIGRKLFVSGKSVEYWLRKHGIDTLLATGARNPNYKGGIPKCPDCGIQKSYAGKRCRKCMGLASRGENSPSWKPDKKLPRDIERVWRTRAGATKWRNLVLARDGCKCRACGTQSRKLNVHHLRNFQSNPTLRLLVRNGVTMCKPCHIKFHKTYGYRNNDPVQFVRFVRFVDFMKSHFVEAVEVSS